MSRIEDQKFKVTCPNPKCAKDLELRIGDAISFRKARCQRCGAEMKIESGAANDLQRAMRDFQRASESFSEAQDSILDGAEIKLRN